MNPAIRTPLTILFAAVIGAIIGITAILWLQKTPETITQRPEFTLPDLQGQALSISDWDGQVVVLNFWATWCTPCREEIPLLNELQQRFYDDGVRFVGVAIDDLEPIRGFLAQVPMNYPTVYGMTEALDVSAAYGNDRGTLPYTVIIDRQGNIIERFMGQIYAEDLVPVLEKAIRQR